MLMAIKMEKVSTSKGWLKPLYLLTSINLLVCWYFSLNQLGTKATWKK